MKISKQKRLLSFFGTACIALVALWLLYNYRRQTHEEANPATAPLKHQFYAEKIITPLYTSVMGSVVPQTTTTLGAEISGQIKKIYIRQGQNVKANETLADIDDKTYLAELNRTKNESSSLKAQLQQRKDLYERTDRLFKKEAATPIEWEKAKSDYLYTLAQFEAARENVNSLSTRHQKTKITAPYDGIIGNKMVDEGDFVLPGNPLFLLYTTGAMDVEFYVPERYIHNIHIGDSVAASLELNAIHTTATIFEITPYEDIGSRTFRVRAHLNGFDSILAGAFVRIQFPVGEKLSVFVPLQAVERVGQLEMVKVFQNGRWDRQYIRTGSVIDGQIEVTSGLVGGEMIGYDR